MERISAAMGIGEDLKNVASVICLRSVNGFIIFCLGAKGCVEELNIYACFMW